MYFQVAIWHVFIKDSEISSYMKLAGLAWPKHQKIISAHYNFDQLSGTVLIDSSGQGHNGTLVGGPKWTEVSFSCKIITSSRFSSLMEPTMLK